MTRAQGFARGDLDTAFPLDDKFLELRGRMSPEKYYAAAGVYFHVVAATWRESERKPALRVCPDAVEIIAELQAARLLDSTGCVPRRAFSHSVGRATVARRASTARQAANRARKSHGVTRDKSDTARDTAPLRSALTRSVGTEGTEGTTGSPEGGDPYDDVVQWLAQRKAWVDGRKLTTDLARMVDRRGASAVIAAMAEVPDAEDAAQFIYGARNALFPLNGSRTVSKADREAAEARAAIDAAKGPAR